jgi:hypothetical protein
LCPNYVLVIRTKSINASSGTWVMNSIILTLLKGLQRL